MFGDNTASAESLWLVDWRCLRGDGEVEVGVQENDSMNDT